MKQAARVVGGYELLEELGRGGMGRVYRARQIELRRIVAVKELLAFDTPDRELAQRFVREARLAGSLNHPNIVTVHDYFEHAGRPYIAMEFLALGSLRGRMQALTLTQTAGILQAILAGLAHAEASGIVHRDIKPENLLLDREGRVKIADFGIAKAFTTLWSGGVRTAGGALGTPAYMAPEQVLGDAIGPATDLYAVGVIAFEIFAGRPPFDGGELTPLTVMFKQVNEGVPPLSAVCPDVHPAISEWVERLLVKDPAQRTSSAAAAWEQFEEIVIDLAGPRWQRAARLPAARADAAPAPDTPPPDDLPPGPMTAVAVPDTIVAQTADDAAGPRVRGSNRRKRATFAIGVLGIAVAAAIAVAIDPFGGDAPVVESRLTAGAVSVVVPAGWERTSEPVAVTRVGFVGPATIAPGGNPARGAVTIGLGPKSASNATLIAPAFRAGLRHELLPPVPVELAAGMHAYRFDKLRPRGTRNAVTVYVSPTTAGVATLACTAPLVPAGCATVARSLRVADARPFAVGPSADFARRVARVLGPLKTSLQAARRDLRGAPDASTQAAATNAAARAFRAAAGRMSEDGLSPADVTINAQIRAALERSASAFDELANAARQGAAAGWSRAASRAGTAQAGLGEAIRVLRAIGYGTFFDIELRPVTVRTLGPPPDSSSGGSSGGSASPPPPPPPAAVLTPPPPPPPPIASFGGTTPEEVPLVVAE